MFTEVLGGRLLGGLGGHELPQFDFSSQAEFGLLWVVLVLYGHKSASLEGVEETTAFGFDGFSGSPVLTHDEQASDKRQDAKNGGDHIKRGEGR